MTNRKKVSGPFLCTPYQSISVSVHTFCIHFDKNAHDYFAHIVLCRALAFLGCCRGVGGSPEVTSHLGKCSCVASEDCTVRPQPSVLSSPWPVVHLGARSRSPFSVSQSCCIRCPFLTHAGFLCHYYVPSLTLRSFPFVFLRYITSLAFLIHRMCISYAHVVSSF